MTTPQPLTGLVTYLLLSWDSSFKVLKSELMNIE